MQRLFKVQLNPKDAPSFFDCKLVAKFQRNKLREKHSRGDIVVMRGPDHRLGESFNVSRKTEKAGKRGW